MSPRRSRGRTPSGGHLLRPLALGCILLAGHAPAASLAWLDFNGQIQGEENADAAHHDWIVIKSFNFAVQRGTQGPFSFGLTKKIDKATPALFGACANGFHFPKVRLDLVDSSTQTPTDICRLELTDAVVTSQTTTGANTTTDPVEKIQLSFRQITYSYFLKDLHGGNPTQYYGLYDYVFLAGETGTGVPPTSPNPDSDNDGLPDAWEFANGLQVGINDAAADADGDGFTNLEEFQLGTNPQSGFSYLRVTVAFNITTLNSANVSWNAVPGKTYLLEWSPDLITAFTTIATVTPNSETGSTTVPATSNGMGFYRVRLQP